MTWLGFVDPVAFHLGPIPVHWYGIIFVLAILSAYAVAAQGAKFRGLNVDFLSDLSVVVVISGILGARLYEVFVLQYDRLDYYLANPGKILATWEGGLAIHGGVLGALLVGGIYAIRKKQSFWAWADVIGPGLILAQGVGRWGNFFNQEAYGSPAPASLVEAMPNWLREGMTIQGTVMHPTFLYESLWNVLCFGLLYAVLKKRNPPVGVVFSLYMILYNVGRLVIESIREDSSYIFGTLRIAQLMAIAMIVAGAGFLVWHLRRNQRAETAEAPEVQ
jgi:phosphatidylglycerol---prolipoprotein diacylglyceryl transferase